MDGVLPQGKGATGCDAEGPPDSRDEEITMVDSMVFAAPELPKELALCTVWEEILGVTQVGIHDDFFTLGGHSLAAM